MRIAICLVHISLSASAAFAQDLSGETIYERCSGAIVEVGVQDDLGRIRSGGTGIVLKDSAWLVTNYHIFEKGGYLVAQKDGVAIDITGGILRADSERDVLIFRIKPESEPGLWAQIPRLSTVRYADLKRGQRVYAIGNPAGLETTITDGLLSGLRTSEDTAFKLVQISAPISAGSSGGGVFDDHGRLIAMSTFIIRPRAAQNLNFALPVDEIVDWDRATTRKDIHETSRNEHYEAGLQAWRAHHCEEAIANFRLVPEDDKSKGQALYYTARCLHQQNQFAQAREGYERALAKDDRIARAHLFLAVLLYRDGDTLGSFQHQTRAYELEPSLRDVKVTTDDW